jgi:hypothetical protein
MDHEDLRVLVTLDRDEGGQTAGPPRQAAFTIRSAIVQALHLSPKQIPDATLTRTGYAIVASDTATRDLLLEQNNATEILRICGGSAINRPEKWYRYAVKEVPYTFRRHDGTAVDTRTIIEEEVFVQTKQTPRDISESRHGADPLTGRGTFIISFLQPVKAFRLFSTSEMSKLIDKKPLLRIHNPGCQGYCSGSKCKRVHRCGRCGDRLDKHAGPCTAPHKCANCCGPFTSGHADCPAKPSYQGGRWVPIGKRARAAVRAAGSRLYAEANPVPEIQMTDQRDTADKRARSPEPERDARSPSPPTSPALSVIEVASDAADPRPPATPAQGARAARLPRVGTSMPQDYNVRNRFSALLCAADSAELGPTNPNEC